VACPQALRAAQFHEKLAVRSPNLIMSAQPVGQTIVFRGLPTPSPQFFTPAYFSVRT
jgi:hypothetical protein